MLRLAANVIEKAAFETKGTKFGLRKRDAAEVKARNDRRRRAAVLEETEEDRRKAAERLQTKAEKKTKGMNASSARAVRDDLEKKRENRKARKRGKIASKSGKDLKASYERLRKDAERKQKEAREAGASFGVQVAMIVMTFMGAVVFFAAYRQMR